MAHTNGEANLTLEEKKVKCQHRTIILSILVQRLEPRAYLVMEKEDF